MKDIYPLTIIKDRYQGLYSKGNYTAWNQYFCSIPIEIDGQDLECAKFWDSFDSGELIFHNMFKERVFAGRGHTPQEALEDLQKRLLKYGNRKID